MAKSQGIFTLLVVALGRAVVGETERGEISGKGKGKVTGVRSTPDDSSRLNLLRAVILVADLSE